MNRWLSWTLVVTAAAAWTLGSALADEKHPKEEKEKTKTITGEVVDMACYLDHGAKGEKHKDCATQCITGGLPVGILTGDEVYLIIGDHRPINDKLATLAAQKVKVTGKVSSRNGVHLIAVTDPDKDIIKQ